MKIELIKPNKDNPRVIRGNKFDKLVNSIKEFPEMLKLRPIVIDEDNIILGGNMRYKACVEAGLKDIPVKVAKSLTEAQKKEFIIKDNVGFGEWDWDLLANDWNEKQIEEWGLDVWQPEEDIEDEIESILEDENINTQFPKCIMCNQDLIIGDNNNLDNDYMEEDLLVIQTNAECINEDCEVKEIYYNTLLHPKR